MCVFDPLPPTATLHVHSCTRGQFDPEINYFLWWEWWPLDPLMVSVDVCSSEGICHWLTALAAYSCIHTLHIYRHAFIQRAASFAYSRMLSHNTHFTGSWSCILVVENENECLLKGDYLKKRRFCLFHYFLVSCLCFSGSNKPDLQVGWSPVLGGYHKWTKIANEEVL